MTYRTPGVYVEEIATLPPSIAQGATAVPAFVGYTEKAPDPPIARIESFLEYQDLFGGPQPAKFEVNAAGPAPVVSHAGGGGPMPAYLMYYAMSHYFTNGGGACYVVSVGDYSGLPDKDELVTGVGALEAEDEPTLIVAPDAVNAGTSYGDVYTEALKQCNKLGDRFTIMDVPGGVGAVDTFRGNVGNDYLKYGAAYLPYLNTSIAYRYREEDVEITGANGGAAAGSTWTAEVGGIAVTFAGTAGATPAVKIVQGAEGTPTATVDAATRRLEIRDVANKNVQEVVDAISASVGGGFSVAAGADATAAVVHTNNANVDLALQPAAGGGGTTLAAIATSNTALYNQVKAALSGMRVTLPPSPAIAGVYARVDRDRGVWKAPANVSLFGTIGPTEKITHERQEGLNVDPDNGKSINAIRMFAGKGTLVWGARTLAGNDNEWRYVPVRRLFSVIEEATRKGSSFAVFEPNDATTWLKVKGMIEAYLYGLWEQGALAGPTPDSAYFVNVGLGKTMTPQDVLEGRMIVEIGIAAVRPAEFIIIRFSHKLQEA